MKHLIENTLVSGNSCWKPTKRQKMLFAIGLNLLIANEWGLAADSDLPNETESGAENVVDIAAGPAGSIMVRPGSELVGNMWILEAISLN